MKVLIWYCREFKINNVVLSKRIKPTEQKDITKEELSIKNTIVPWITIESKDDIEYLDFFLKDLIIFKERFKTNKIVLVPFSHLTEKIAKKEVSFFIFKKIKELLLKNNFKVEMVHFGSSKDVLIDSPADEYQLVHRSYPLKNFKKDFKI